MRHLVCVRAMAAAAVLGIFCGQAQGASFDCRHAASSREHLICETPGLSALDDRLGAAYAGKQTLLSPAGKAVLRKSQQSWFAYTQTICGFPTSVAVLPVAAQPTFAACLERAYRDRLSDLAQTGRFGSYVFVRVDIYRTSPAPDDDDTGGAVGFYTFHLGYPQIDRAASDAQRAWNDKARTWAGNEQYQAGTDGSDEDVEVKVGLVTDRLISAQRLDYEYPHGVAHGMQRTNVWTVLLSSPLRRIASSDLFTISGDWHRQLGDIALAAIEQHGWVSGGRNNEEEIRSIAVDPAHWFLRPEGLELSFSEGDGGCHVCTPRDGLVPWSRLRPIMKKTGLVP